MSNVIRNNHGAAGKIANREEFRNARNSFSGDSHTPGNYAYRGQLPRGFAKTLEEADYIVFSYSTPIAWHVADGWIVPPWSYSNTTGKHQSIVRSALHSALLSPRNLAAGWQLGLGPTSVKILNAIRCGYAVDLGTRRRATFEAVVATGEAKWSDDGLSIVPADDSHIRP